MPKHHQFKIGLLLLSFIIALSLPAQRKLKAGVGLNFISGNSDIIDLDSYFAPSVHINYTFYQYSRFSLALESATSFKVVYDKDLRRSGFTTSLPVMMQYDFRKTLVYIGAGPAYLSQSVITSQYKHRIDGPCLNMTAGAGFTCKRLLFIPEINPRLSFFKC